MRPLLRLSRVLQLVCSLAVLGHKDAITDVLLGAVSDEAVRCIGKFSPDDLCNIVWAAASVGHGSMIEAELMETVIRRMVLLEMHKVIPMTDHPAASRSN